MSQIPFVDLKTQYNALKDEIQSGITRVLDHGQFIMGPEVSDLESRLADYVGCRYALTCNSGTDAALLAMMALEIRPGDEVITTAFSFIATAETIALLGAVPVFVDIDPETYNIDVNQVEKAITSKTKAIQPVSLYGQPCDFKEINDLAEAHDLWVIEDAAQSFGATYSDKKSGHLCHFGVTSFFPAKPLGCYGDGGAVFTDNEEWAERVRQIRNHGSSERYYHTRIGMNGRFDTIQAAILLAKMNRYPWEIEQRQKAADRYTAMIQESVGDRVTTPIVRNDRTSVWAQYTLRVPERERIRESMKEQGVPTAVHYPLTMADQPAYKEVGRTHSIEYSRQAANEVMSLPMHGDIQENDQEAVVNALKKAVEEL